MQGRRCTDWFVYLAVRVFICTVQAMQMSSCRRLAACLAWIASRVLHVREQVIDDNLREVFPSMKSGDRHRLARAMWEHLIVMACEIAHAPRKIHRTNWRQYFTMHKNRQMMEYFLDSRPTIVVSGHFGNFEMAGYVAG